MKSIIIYATKYGTTQKAAKMLESKMDGEVTLVNIMKENVQNLNQYDNVILAGSIYIGKIQKKLKNYIDDNLSELLKKRIGLFICAGHSDDTEGTKELKSSFPLELYNYALAKEIFGFEYDFNKLNFIDRFILSKVIGNSNNICSLSEDKINNFAKVMSV